MASLSGRTALVTGAAKRIGRELAIALAEEGADCLLHYRRSADAVSETRARCAAAGVRAESIAADLERPEEVSRLAGEAAERGVDLLVHNASVFSRLPFLESGADGHAAMLARDLQVHVQAPYLLARILGERMVARGWGRIVILGDWTSEAAVYRNFAPYLVSKAAVPTLVRVLALELGTRCPAVTANAILPGPILPPEGHDAADFEAVRRETILGEWIGPGEIVRALLYLVGSAGVTGESLRVDGGRAAKGR